MAKQPAPQPVQRPLTAVTPESFRHDFDEDLSALLDIDRWDAGRDLDAEYQRIEHEVHAAAARETEYETQIRGRLHRWLQEVANAPRCAGLYRVNPDEIASVHRGILFNGLVEACDGNSNMHPSLALTIYQIGVTLVSYRGECGSWQHRLFRRDLRQHSGDPMEDVLDLLQRRGRRGSLEERDRDVMSELGRRGLMSFAERAVLVHKAKAPWRMGHGSPAPLELICNYFTDLVIESIRVIRKLIEHQRFVFVASTPVDRALRTIGQSLHPLEYAIIGTLRDRIEMHLEDWRQTHPATVDTTWEGETLAPGKWIERFRDEVAPNVVYGVYRATRFAPAQLFYAHVDHAHNAARIAMADSVFVEYRGFPQLIHLADRYCGLIYGGDTLREMADAAYLDAGAPFRYQSERETRDL